MRTIKAKNGKELNIAACAITPLLYQNDFGAEISTDLAEISAAAMSLTGEAEQAETVKKAMGISYNKILQLAYVMNKTAEYKRNEPFLGFTDWLLDNPTLSPMEIVAEVISEAADGFF